MNGGVSMTSDIWFEKYRPKTLADISISQQKIDMLLQWFRDFKLNKTEYRALLFIGPPGLGKTTLARIIFDKAGYDAREYNASDIRSKKLVNSNFDYLMSLKNIDQLVNSEARPTAIIMDEVDGMCKGDRGGLEELLSFIPSKRKKTSKTEQPVDIPVICICNTGNIKMDIIKQLKTKCTEINFYLPDNQTMLKTFQRITVAESMTFDTEETIEHIIKYSQSDFRRMINILEYLRNRYGTTITMSHIEDSYSVLCQKEQDLHVTDNVRKLINNEMSYMDVINIYNRDKSKVPMVIHENYLNAIRTQKVGFFTKLSNAIECINSLVESDLTEKHMYNTQAWYLQCVQGVSCAYIPNYYMNKEQKSMTSGAKWTSILPVDSHSHSLQKKMHELIFTINRKYSYCLTDVQFLCSFILHALTCGQVEYAVKLMINYGLISDDDISNKKKKPIGIVTNLFKYIKLNTDADKWIPNAEVEVQFNNALDKYKKTEITERIHQRSAVTKRKIAIVRRISPVVNPVVNPISENPQLLSKSQAEQSALAKNRKTIVIAKIKS